MSKPNKQRLAIANFCGVICPYCKNTGYLPRFSDAEYAKIRELVNGPKGQPRVSCGNLCRTPDYPNDVQAMQEAVKKLTREQKHTYAVVLGNALFPNGWQNWYDTLQASEANAQQRADAFSEAIRRTKKKPVY